eukprot:8895-Prorocentrum_minimum.AAC.2
MSVILQAVILRLEGKRCEGRRPGGHEGQVCKEPRRRPQAPADGPRRKGEGTRSAQHHQRVSRVTSTREPRNINA